MTKKQKRNLWRICIAALLLAVCLFLPFKGHVKMACFLVPYLLVGWDVLYGAVRNLFGGRWLDENFLMAVATVGAFCLDEYPEGVAVMLFYQVGELFQSIAVGRSRNSIKALMALRPDKANLLRDGVETQVSPKKVQVGDLILVRPGERVPLDGVVVEGQTTLDTSALTGESLPKGAGVGAEVMSGCVSLTGVITLQVMQPFAQSTVSKILKLMESAAAKKAKTEQFITRFARYYTPCVVAGALLLAVALPLILGQPFGPWVRRGLVFLVVSCPCALVVSVPLSFFGGIGRAAKEGILAKGATGLEKLAALKQIAFDKTGTLTTGEFVVQACLPLGISENRLLGTAACLEGDSSHPIGRSLLAACPLPLAQKAERITQYPGFGIEGILEGKVYYLGNRPWMEQLAVADLPPALPETVIYLADATRCLGQIVLSDQIKEEAGETMAKLTRLGVEKKVLLTGDGEAAAERVAGALGLDEYFARLLPQDKVERVEQLLDPKLPLAFVGDGINDAPVLTRADVGIAMGGLGSDAALEAADVVLMQDDLSRLPLAIGLARKTVLIVKQNIWFALLVKGIVLILGAFGLAGMWLAVFADVGVMVLAILNAMRTLYGKLES